jgi:hypothetical protein
MIEIAGKCTDALDSRPLLIRVAIFNPPREFPRILCGPREPLVNAVESSTLLLSVLNSAQRAS